ncbi:hypothetical protein [Streptomyces sulphureus]|uniref:hypothetical protein n=1 Tax=Streptomyces sulphureus TaxID=47758 RepID=UPI00037B47E6|nr:hypothetical protein [Streptomyces sulphureus]
MIDTLVSNNDRDRYPAVVDPAETNDEGYVKPWFDLETVRRIAEKTQADATEVGHGSVDTVHVVDGGEENGEPRVLVVVVTWMDIGSKGVDQATEIVVPDRETGRYAIGGFPWCWYALDDHLNPLILRAEK